MPLDSNIFGEGVYTPREAARLIGSNPQEVLRWTRGSGPTKPLWHAYYQYLDDTAELNFADLIELRVVLAFRRSGISLQAIRFAIDVAERKFGVSRPLSTKAFMLLGSDIVMSALENDGDLVSLARRNPGQKIFAEIVKQSLSDLEYESDHVARWRPSFAEHIVIDPTRSFGAPILDAYGISTRTLFRDFKEFEDEKYLAKIYEIPIRFVKEAIRFEDKLEAQTRLNGKSPV